MRSAILACFLLLFFSGQLCAQKDGLEKTVTGNVTVFKDPRIDTLVARIYYANYPKSTLKGYRVQIYSGSNRSDAIKIKADFLDTYMGETIYFDYKQPYYKIRVGDYRNKMEAQKMYQTLLQDGRFKGVLIVPDEINFPGLKTQTE
jgi:hypothetical protein